MIRPFTRRDEGELARLRQAAGLTQVEAALRLGVRQSVVSRWEAGRMEMRVGQFVAVMRLYGVSEAKWPELLVALVGA